MNSFETNSVPGEKRPTPSLPVFIRGLTSDDAWDQDGQVDKYNFKPGDRFVLKQSTKGDFSYGTFVVPAGTSGVMVNPRTPRVTKPSPKYGKRFATYFANVEVVVDGLTGRIRVPHSALTKIRETKKSKAFA